MFFLPDHPKGEKAMPVKATRLPLMMLIWRRVEHHQAW